MAGPGTDLGPGLDPAPAIDPTAPTVAEDVPQSVPAPEPEPLPAPSSGGMGTGPDADVRTVLENGIREIAGEVRNSLDFHRSQDGGGEVSLVVLSGSALDQPGFAEALQEQLGVQVERESVRLDGQDLGGISPHRLAIAAGLAVEEVPQ